MYVCATLVDKDSVHGQHGTVGLRYNLDCTFMY